MFTNFVNRRCGVSEVVGVRVPREVKVQMDAFSDVNWPEVIREAILRKVKEERRRRAREVEDNIRSRTAGTSHIVLSKIIREERDAG